MGFKVLPTVFSIVACFQWSEQNPQPAAFPILTASHPFPTCPWVSLVPIRRLKTVFCTDLVSRVKYLRSSIGHIQVMKGDILNNFFFLVYIALWQGDVLFSFKVKFCGISITSALPLWKRVGGGVEEEKRGRGGREMYVYS